MYNKRIVLSDKKSYWNKDSFKYFIRYRHKSNAFPSWLCIKLPQMNAYPKHFETWNKLKVYLKKNLIVNQWIMINTLRLK